MKKIRQIPIIIGFLILLAGLGGGILLVQKGQTFFLRADPEATPSQVKITNLTEGSFTVSWTTDKKVIGQIRYGENSQLDLSTADDRDQSTEKTDLFLTHHVTLKNLRPNTLYYFKIVSGTKTYDNNGQLYQVTTAPTISLPPPPSDPAYGKIITQGDQPAQGAIVYLSLANTQAQSALVQDSGNWMIPLNLARSNNLNSYASYDQEASIEEIFVQAGKAGTATAVTTTKNDSPVPVITLGQSFDFRTTKEETALSGIIQEEEEEEEATQEGEPTPTPTSGFTVEPQGTIAPKELAIINPDEDDAVNTQKPSILGTGPAGETIEITIESSTSYTGTVVVDSQGNWQWTPPADLEPGEHTVTATFTDNSGEVQTVFHTFTVLAAGEDETPAIEATPSAETTPTATPTATVTPTAAPRTGIPSTEGGIPDSGHLTPTFLVFIMGLGFILIGFVIKSIIMS